jgi:hypothetical protein
LETQPPCRGRGDHLRGGGGLKKGREKMEKKIKEKGKEESH